MAQGRLNAIQTLTATIGFDVYTKAEADAKFATKESVYTKQETDDLLDGKADKATTLSGYGITDAYTKTESNSLLDAKADKSNTYTKTETNSLLDTKADKSTTLAGYGITDAYTKTQTDNLLSEKADADFVYTKSEIDTKIPNTVGSTTKPVYVNGGVVSACTYELNKTVPANAVFTDTTYTAGNGLNLSGTSFSAKAGTNVTVDGNGINVNGNGAVASANTGLINGGTAYTELRPTLDGTWVKNAQTTGVNLQKLEGGIEYLYAILSKQYDQLKKYINGNYYDYDTDTDSKYTKTVPAGAMPYASLNEVGGETVVWNQLVNHANIGASKEQNGITFTNNGDGSVTVSGTATGGNAALMILSPRTWQAHHYCLQGCPSGGSSTTYNLRLYGAGSNFYDTGDGVIWYHATALYKQCEIVIMEGTAINTPITFKPTFVDLTLLYGAGNEPTTVAEFQQMFPASYYSYNAGTLLSAGVTEVVSVGKNLCDGIACLGAINSGYAYIVNSAVITSPYTFGTTFQGALFHANVIAGKTYVVSSDLSTSINDNYFVGIYNSLAEATNRANCLEKLTAYAGSNTFTPTVSGVAVFMKAYNGGSVVSWTKVQLEVGTTATTYSPYQEHSYPIPASIQALEGYGWSAGTVYNYIDFEAKKFVQEVGSRAYASGDESDSTVVTDMTTTYYPLNPAVETDISAYLTDDNLIEVEPNGTLTFPNANGDDYRIPIPSSETYMVDLQGAI